VLYPFAHSLQREHLQSLYDNLAVAWCCIFFFAEHHPLPVASSDSPPNLIGVVHCFTKDAILPIQEIYFACYRLITNIYDFTQKEQPFLALK
jgi:hypothetical protein